MKFQLTPVVLTVLTTVATAQDHLRGSGSEPSMQEYLHDKIEQGTSELRDRVSGFHDQHPHPFVDGVHNIVSHAQTVHQHVRDSIVKFHDEMIRGRHELAERLATYEEGSRHFSIECAEQSRSEKACISDQSCNWCTSDKLVALKQSGLCASKEASKELALWGLECGGEGDWMFIPEMDMVEEAPETMEEVPETMLMASGSSSGSEDIDPLSTAETGDLTDLLFVSEVAFDQPEDEAEMLLLMQEEEEDASAFDDHCLYQESVQDCDQGNDGEGNSCVWCKYNSWLGKCIVVEDTDLVTGEFAMTCADKSMV